MVTIIILIIVAIIFVSKKFFHNEDLKRLANIAAIILFIISILTNSPIQNFPNTEKVTPTVDHFIDVQKPLIFEFTITNRYSKQGYCAAREYVANLDAGTHLLMEYQLQSISPDYFYAFEISGPDFSEPLRLEGVDYYFLDRIINKSGKYRVVFSYCAAYALNGTLKISEGDWSATNTEVKSTP
jgi:hypothetical protein